MLMLLKFCRGDAFPANRQQAITNIAIILSVYSTLRMPMMHLSVYSILRITKGAERSS